MSIYPLSVIDLAMPSPQCGSIDTYSGYGSATSKLAIRAHQLFQSAMLLENSLYEAEVDLQGVITHGEFTFAINGRADGMYRENPARIEEIKTAADIKKMMSALGDNYFTHPYWLQLQCYGYLHYLKTKNLPNLNLLIISLRNKTKVETLTLEFDIQSFEAWLDKRLQSLVLEINASKAQIARRKTLATHCTFPFEKPRDEQLKLMDSIETNMALNKHMLMQAPTGLGKTLGVVFPVLKESLSRGQKTIYVTPKNSQHAIAIQSVNLIQNKGALCKTFMLTSKRKLCMKPEPVCSSAYCEFAKEHYTKCSTHEVLDKIKQENNLNEAFFKQLALTFRVCPYELQMRAIPFSDVVVGDYNYVFTGNIEHSKITKALLGENQKANLVIDEAHNLPTRSMDYYSPSLEINFFEAFLTLISEFPNALKKSIHALITRCIELVQMTAQLNATTPHRVKLSLVKFKQHEERILQTLSQYLESNAIIKEGDYFLKLMNYWSDFTHALEFAHQEQDKFFIVFDPLKNQVKINCCDASLFLKQTYLAFQQVVGFSATIKPFTYYSQLMGLNSSKLHTEEFTSPFDVRKRKLLVIPQVSTKYKQRLANYSKIIAIITRIVALKPGNYLVFFPSFDFLEHVYNRMPYLKHTKLLRQERNMSLPAITETFLSLKQNNKTQLLFAVQGGVFAEGIDYVGDLAIGAFIIGPPLPSFDWQREELKRYYESHYKAGKEYAYIYPAMAKAIQAAGRVIRTEADKGLIILLDNRFLHSDYSACMPQDWFQHQPTELVSRTILQEISSFWAQD